MVETVRPVAVDRRLQKTLSECRLEIDADAGVVTWWGDRAVRAGARKPVRLALPGRGSPALARVVRVEYANNDRSGVGAGQTFTGRLWLVDDEGRVAARSAAYAQGTVRRIWPSSALDRLAAVGVEVEDRDYASPRAAAQEFAGGLRTWRIGDQRTLGIAAVVTLVAVLAVVLILSAAG